MLTQQGSSVYPIFFSKIHSFDDIYKLYLVTIYSSAIQNVISRVTLGGINPRSRSNTVTFVDGVEWIAKDSGSDRGNELISSRGPVSVRFPPVHWDCKPQWWSRNEYLHQEDRAFLCLLLLAIFEKANTGLELSATTLLAAFKKLWRALFFLKKKDYF